MMACRIRSGILVTLMVGACVPAPGTNVDPAQSSAVFATRASRSEVLSALSASALELGLSVADANAEAGFWRTNRMHLSQTAFAGMLVGASGVDLDLAAILENVPPDSVRVTVTGTTGFTEATNQYARQRDPIKQSTPRYWAYVDSLSAKAQRRLRQ